MNQPRYILSLTADEAHVLKTALDMGLLDVPESLMARVNALADRARLGTLAETAPVDPAETYRTCAGTSLRMFAEIHDPDTRAAERAAAEKKDREQ